MAISRKIKKRETEGTVKAEKMVSKKEKTSEKKDVSFGLTPHITEKATFLSEKNAYVFKIEPEFNKIMVRQAVKKQYNVEPRKVRIINIPGKMVFIKRRQAQKSRLQKSDSLLEKGDKITIN